MSSGIPVSKINQKENKMLKLIVLMLMCLSSVFASKSVEIKSINDVKEGSFLVRNENGDRYKIIPTVNTSVSIDIKGMVSSTTVDQTFTNDSSEPIEAIYAATIRPAEFFSIQEEMGTIEKGKVADMVLLSKNPIENISNTRQVELVISKGEIYYPDKLMQTIN